MGILVKKGGVWVDRGQPSIFKTVGKHWQPDNNGTLYSAMSPVMDRIYYTPLWLPGESFPIDEVHVWQSGAPAAGGRIQFMLYNDNGSGEPGALSWESAILVNETVGDRLAALPVGTVVDGTPRWAAVRFSVAVASAHGYASGLGDRRFPTTITFMAQSRYQDMAAGAANPNPAAASTAAAGIIALKFRLA